MAKANVHPPVSILRYKEAQLCFLTIECESLIENKQGVSRVMTQSAGRVMGVFKTSRVEPQVGSGVGRFLKGRIGSG